MATLKEVTSRTIKTEGVVNISSIRVFEVPIINVNARSFYLIVNLNGREAKQLPAIKHLSDLEIEVIQKNPLKLNYPCHNQHVEKHVKLVTEALSQCVALIIMINLFGKN